MSSARLCDVLAVGGPADGKVLSRGERWNDRHVWNVDAGGAWHRYVKKARSEVAEYEGHAHVIAVFPGPVEAAHPSSSGSDTEVSP